MRFVTACTLLASAPLLGFITPSDDSPPLPEGCTSADPKKCPAIEQDLFLKDKWVMFTNVEFLLWKVNESALDFAIKMDKPSWSSTETYAVGNYKNATFDWDPGVRIAFGYFNAPNYWDVFVQYAFLHASGENVVHAPHDADRYLNGTWIGPDFETTSSASPLKKAHSQIDLYYNVLDGMFSRRFHPNPHFRLNLFGGLTAAFIHQSWNVRYRDLANDLSKIRNKWSYAGAGPRIGIKIDWFMRMDFYLTGLVSAAILTGNYTNSAFQNTNAPVPLSNNSIPFRNTHFKDFRLVPTAQIFVGPSWQKVFKEMRTEVFAGYEFTIWNNLHEIYRSSLAGPTAGKDTYINSSVMSLQGISLRGTLDF